MSTHLTEHGGKRIKQRVGIPKRAAERLAARALTEGATHGQFTGSMKRYLDKVFLQYGTANNMRVLNGYLFLFGGQTLITCWILPEQYRRAKPKAVAA